MKLGIIVATALLHAIITLSAMEPSVAKNNDDAAFCSGGEVIDWKRVVAAGSVSRAQLLLRVGFDSNRARKHLVRGSRRMLSCPFRLMFSPQGRYLAGVFRGDPMLLLDTCTLLDVSLLTAAKRALTNPCAVAFSGDEKQLVASSGGILYVFNLNEDKQAKQEEKKLLAIL